jgi:membrane carboxypeptidase/penicillin-binding protein PbpC
LPLAGEIFRALPAAGSPAAWPGDDDALRRVQVCALSGLPATPWCPSVRVDLVPRDELLTRRCDVHWPAPGAPADSKEVIERWPGSPRAWDLAQVQAPIVRNPNAGSGSIANSGANSGAGADSNSNYNYNSNDNSNFRPGQRGPIAENREARALQILQPVNNACFVLTGEPNGDRVRLQSSLDGQARVHWFLDDHYLGPSDPATPLYLALTEGDHKLTCVTPGNQTTISKFSVVKPEGRPAFKRQ